MILSIVCYPVLLFYRWIGYVQSSADAGLIVRSTLATIHVVSLLFFAVVSLVTGRRKGKLVKEQKQVTRTFFLLITLTQFSNLFWAGRTTPNGVVAPVVNVSLALLLMQSASYQAIWCARTIAIALLICSAVIARSELVGLIVPGFAFALQELSSQHEISAKASIGDATPKWRSTIKFIVILAGSGLLAIATTVGLDTYMWGRAYDIRRGGLLWPELEAVLFNVVEGKSAEWGVSAWHTYFTAHLPKLLSFPALFVPAAISDVTYGRTSQSIALRKAVILALAHVTLLSVLGHKEARFVSYTVPLFNLLAATGAANLWQHGRSRSSLLAKRSFVLLALLASAALATLSTMASMSNYPGGEALAVLHRLRGHENANVHIDVLPAMTGVSLFQSVFNQERSRPGAFGLDALPDVLPSPDRAVRWAYDKTERLYSRGSKEYALIDTFTYIVSDHEDCHRLPNFRPMRDEEGEVMAFSQFAGLRLSPPRDFLMRIKDLASSRNPPNASRLLSLSPLHIGRQDVTWLCERRTTGAA